MASAPIGGTKKKLNMKDFMFSQQENNHDLIKKPGEVNGLEFRIRFLTNCTAALYDQTAAVMVDQCKDTTLIVGPVAGSIFVRDCENCTVHVACQQFRCRDLKNCKIYLYAMNDPVIEASSGLTFAPFNIGYPCLREQALAAKLDLAVNRWELVFDFSNKGVANHAMMPPNEFTTELKTIPGFEDQPNQLVFDYPQRYGGTMSDDKPESSAEHDQSMQAFGIQTGQKAAQQAVQQPANVAPPVTIAAPIAAPSMVPQMVPQMQPQMQSQDFNSAAGFNTSFTGMGQQQKPQDDGEDWTEEELALMAQVEQQNKERQQSLFTKQQEETNLKNQRKASAQAALADWKNQKDKQTAQSKQNNLAVAAQREQEEFQTRSSVNPWQRVIENVEFNANGTTMAGKDVSRMKQAMLARRQDLTQAKPGQEML